MRTWKGFVEFHLEDSGGMSKKCIFPIFLEIQTTGNKWFRYGNRDPLHKKMVVCGKILLFLVRIGFPDLVVSTRPVG